MLKGATIITLAIMASACSSTPGATIKTEPCDPAMRDWILQCIEKANPHSDEEPEDNTAQCERTATRLFCGPSCFVSMNGQVACQASR